MLGGAKIANFKSFDPHVRLVLNSEYTLPAFRCGVDCVQNRGFARVASESNKAVVRISGHTDAHQLFVDSAAHVNRAAGVDRVGRMLNGSPGRGLGTGVGIVAGRRHIIRGIRLGRGSRGTRKQDQHSHEFHAYSP